MSLLALEGVTVARGGRVLATGIDLTVAPGGAVAIAGPNGAGKSSLIRMMAGLLAPAAGTVRRNAPQALMGEAAALDAERTLGDALAFWARLDGGEAGARVAEALAAVALAPLAAVPVRFLSSGQRRRAGLARVIAADAALWLLDEPANALDAASIERLEGAVARHRAGGGGVVIASHQAVALPGASLLAMGGARG